MKLRQQVFFPTYGEPLGEAEGGVAEKVTAGPKTHSCPPPLLRGSRCPAEGGARWTERAMSLKLAAQLAVINVAQSMDGEAVCIPADLKGIVTLAKDYVLV